MQGHEDDRAETVLMTVTREVLMVIGCCRSSVRWFRNAASIAEVFYFFAEGIMSEAGYVDCHIRLNEGSPNVLYKNGSHQIALSIWYRICDMEKFEGDSVAISLINQETGVPLDMDGGWQWSWSAQCTTYLERRDGEVGSRPENESDYFEKIVYITCADDQKPTSSVLVGARIYYPSPAGTGVGYIQSQRPVRVHAVAQLAFSWWDFDATDPVVNHRDQADNTYNWTIDSDLNCLWRSADIFIAFKDSNKSVTRVVYNTKSSNYWDVGVFSMRRRNLYQVVARIWSFESASNVRSETVYFDMAGQIVSRPYEFQQGNGFVVTLFCYVAVHRPPLDDVDGATYSDTVDIYDEFDTKTTLFLNQVIPQTWGCVIKNNTYEAPGTKFSGTVLDNSPQPLPAKSVSNCWINNSRFGNATIDYYEGTGILCNDSPYCKFIAQWWYGYGPTAISLNGWDLDGNQWGITERAKGDGDDDYFVVQWTDRNAVFRLIPKWDEECSV